MLSSKQEIPAKLADDAVGEIKLVRIDTLTEEVEQFSDTQYHASGGGGSYNSVTGGHLSPITITSKSTRFHRVWARDPNDNEVTITVDSDVLPIRSGHMISVVYAVNAPKAVPLYLYNTETKKTVNFTSSKNLLKRLETGFSPRRVMQDGIGWLISICCALLIFVAILMFIESYSKAPGVNQYAAEKRMQPLALFGIFGGLPLSLFLVMSLRRGKLVKDYSSSLVMTQAKEFLTKKI